MSHDSCCIKSAVFERVCGSGKLMEDLQFRKLT